jgi:hypothetical protein
MRVMSRPAIATLLGLAGFLLYVAAVLVLADQVHGLHWSVEFAFFAVAGIAWVWPARRLIIWAVR